MKTDWVWFGVTAIAIAFFVAFIFWSGEHPSREEDVACIRAGYDRATYVYIFAPEPYCEKTVRVKLADIKE